MRRTPVILAAAALVAVGLVGCSTAPSGTGACSPETSAALDGIEVSGDTDAAPRVDIRAPFHVTETTTSVREAGDGPQIESTDQLVLLDISVFGGETGESIVATPYDGGTDRVFALSRWVETFPAFADALECVSEGSRVVVGLSPEGIGEQTAAGLGLAEDESAVAVVDVRRVYLSKADGADEFTEGHGLPAVVRAPDGRPGIIVPDAEAPEGLVAETIKRGDGPEITADSTARVHYTAVNWDTREVVDSTWDAEPVSTAAGALPPAVVDALVGETVGSQVLVVVPASEETGGTALAIVLDVLGVD